MIFSADENFILSDAIQKFGVTSQILKAIEETSELNQCLAKHLNENDCKKELLGELADTFIMINQLRLICGAEVVDEIIAEKMQKLKERISEKSAEHNGPYRPQNSEPFPRDLLRDR